MVCLESSRAISDEEGNIIRFQGTLVDITGRRQIEHRLQQQEEFNRRLIECFPDAILALDHEYRCTFASPRVREMLGFSPEELVGKVFNVNAHSEALVRLLRDALSGTLVAGTTEFEMQRRDGVWRWLRCSASQLLDSKNELVGVVASLRDVTEAQQMEQQLLHSERLAAMGQMVDGFAHELNNPLTAIMGGVELLDAKRLDEASSRHLQLLKQQVRRAAEIVQNLLFFSRPPAPGKTRVNVNELIQRTLMLHQYSLRLNNISVDFIPDSAAPIFDADANQLMQVFLNLIVNAEQAIREGTRPRHDSNQDRPQLCGGSDHFPGRRAGDQHRIGPEDFRSVLQHEASRPRCGHGAKRRYGHCEELRWQNRVHARSWRRGSVHHRSSIEPLCQC